MIFKVKLYNNEFEYKDGLLIQNDLRMFWCNLDSINKEHMLVFFFFEPFSSGLFYLIQLLFFLMITVVNLQKVFQ